MPRKELSPENAERLAKLKRTVQANIKHGIDKRKPKRRKPGPKPKPKPMPVMRKCARKSCGEAFYPKRSDQVYCTRDCANTEMQRRYRERYKKFMEASGEGPEGLRKAVISFRRKPRVRPKLLAKPNAGASVHPEIPAEFMAAHEATANGMDELPRNRSPESTGMQPALSPRLRHIRRVHPRSLEKSE